MRTMVWLGVLLELVTLRLVCHQVAPAWSWVWPYAILFWFGVGGGLVTLALFRVMGKHLSGARPVGGTARMPPGPPQMHRVDTTKLGGQHGKQE